MQQSKHFLSYLLVFGMGLILPLAFAPLNIYTLAFISPAVLLYQWLKSTPAQAFVKGFLFGLGFFGLGVSWVYISIHTYGNASSLVSSLITLAMVAFLALFFAVQGYLLIRLFAKKNITALCLAAFPVTWVLFEWMRCLPLNGFPWLFLGYSQISTLFRGFAPIVGVYGISLAVAMMCGSLVLICTRQTPRTKLTALGFLILLIFAGWQLNYVKWTKRTGSMLSVALVQANTSQSVKWQAERFSNILQDYQDLSMPYWGQRRLLVWPEAALPTFAEEIPATIEHLDKTAQQKNSSLLLGVLLAGGPQHFYNGVLLLGLDHGEYRKRHLVPFGEYTPSPQVFSFLLNYWKIPMSNLRAGMVKQTALSVNNIPLAIFICYEIAYPGEVLRYIQDRQLIINISDDSWFGKSIASAQQMQMAQMRALETGRYALLAANTGITAVINSHGRLVSALPPFQKGVLTANVPAMSGKTPLMYFDYYPLIGLMVLILVVALI